MGRREHVVAASYSESASFPGQSEDLLNDVAYIFDMQWITRRITRDGNSVTAWTPIALDWGKKITVLVTGRQDQSIAVQVTSELVFYRPAYPDFGVNRRNVQRLIRQLTERVESRCRKNQPHQPEEQP
jgi:hypothetical protein